MAAPTPVHALTLRNTSNNLGLVGYWSLNDATGTLATDFSGNGNTGTLTNMEVGDWTTGKKSTALTFDGVDEYVDMGNPASGIFDFGTGSFTLSAWFKTSTVDYTDLGYIFNKREVSSGARYAIGMDTNEMIDMEVSSAGIAVTATSNSALNDGNWHLVVGVVDRSAQKIYLYIDTVLQTSQPSISTVGTLTIVAGSLHIGKQSNNSSRYFPGSIDDVRIYNRALSAAEVLALYNATKVGAVRVTPVSDLGLVGYWNLDDGTSTIATDFSGQGNNGVLTDFASPFTSTSGWVAGKRGRALVLAADASYDKLLLNATTSLGTGDFTASAWVFFPSGTTIDQLDKIFLHSASAKMAIDFGGTSDGGCGAATGCLRLLNGAAGTPANNKITSFTPASTDIWQHWAVTRSGTNHKIFLNGAQDAATSTSAIDFPVNTLGGGNGSRFTGTFDEIRLYNRALSAQEIQALYSIGR